MPGAPPRTSTVVTLGSGKTTTVQPVGFSGSVQCPTRMPAMAVMVAGSRIPSRQPRPDTCNDLIGDGPRLSGPLVGDYLIIALCPMSTTSAPTSTGSGPTSTTI